MNEFGLTFSLNSFIDFRNFLFFHFPSFQPNGPLVSVLECMVGSFDFSLSMVLVVVYSSETLLGRRIHMISLILVGFTIDIKLSSNHHFRFSFIVGYH
jgi:hypothetical protein